MKSLSSKICVFKFILKCIDKCMEACLLNKHRIIICFSFLFFFFVILFSLHFCSKPDFIFSFKSHLQLIGQVKAISYVFTFLSTKKKRKKKTKYF